MNSKKAKPARTKREIAEVKLAGINGVIQFDRRLAEIARAVQAERRGHIDGMDAEVAVVNIELEWRRVCPAISFALALGMVGWDPRPPRAPMPPLRHATTTTRRARGRVEAEAIARKQGRTKRERVQRFGQTFDTDQTPRKARDGDTE